MTRCTHCGGYILAGDTLCARCQWMASLGALVTATSFAYGERAFTLAQFCDALDGVAYVLRHRAVTAARHRKELFEEQRGAQRDARDAFADGRREGLHEAQGGGW